MQVKSIQVKTTDWAVVYTADLGRDGKLIVSFPHETGQFGTPVGAVFGNWESEDGESFMLSNNYDNFGHGPGIDRHFTKAEVGAAFEYFWQSKLDGDESYRRWKKEQEHQAYLERKAKREARAKRNATLKGGTGNTVNPGLLFS